MKKPRIFLSAVTRELHSARQLGANILIRLGYEPVWQEIFGTEAGDLRQMLRNQIDTCDGLIHLVGFGYGAEPGEADLDFSRVSYTQFEYCYSRKAGKRTWILLVQEGSLTDLPPMQLDLPPDDHPNPAQYQAERRALQDSWRAKLTAESHIHHEASTATDLELKFERLKNELQGLRRSFRVWQRIVVGLLLVLVIASGLLYATLISDREQHREDVQAVGEDIRKARESIEGQLTEIRPDFHVKSLDVFHHAAISNGDGKEEVHEPRGVIGRNSFGPKLHDRVELKAELTRPGYAYIIAFRPDGEIELCFPDGPNKENLLPRPSSTPHYSMKTINVDDGRQKQLAYGLDEGVGLWIFAVVASEQPLPTFRQWKEMNRRNLSWNPESPTGGIVWRFDESGLEAMTRVGSTRGADAEVKGPASAETVRSLGRVLERTPRAKVSLIGFYVDKQD
jgi:hypothetical protein